MNSFQNLARAIENADAQPAPTNEVLTGFSGEKLLSTLINLSKIVLSKDSVYLEVGVFQGMSLLSVANNLNDIPVYGIDNFAFFDPDGKNESIVNSRISKLNLTNVTLINKDYEEALMHLSDYIGDKKVGLFFVDGPHDYRSQLMCLLLVQPYLSDNAIIIIDDSNYRHVRLANSDFLQTNSEYKLFFEAYTSSHPTNMSPETLQQARKGWWDGVNILVRDKDNLLEPAYPPTLRDRTLHENEHILQTEKYPTLPIELGKYLRQIGNLYARLPKHKTLERGIYDSLNTYSETLPEFHLVQNNLK